jgi:hypothetical protein
MSASSIVPLASLVAAAGALMGTVPAQADPPMHQVVYIVSSRNPAYVDIFFRDQDPAVFSDYSHNPYQFTPQVHADIGPGKQWVQQVPLINPEQWAMVTATTGRAPAVAGGIQCDLLVDGKVVVSNIGPKGALCSLRSW